MHRFSFLVLLVAWSWADSTYGYWASQRYVDILLYSLLYRVQGGELMAMVKLLISVPKRIKVQLDALRKEGTSASGFIRSLLEREFKHRKETQS